MASNSSSSNSSTIFVVRPCFLTPLHSVLLTGINMIYIVVLIPLCAVILHHGVPLLSSPAAMSHSDCFSCHMVLIELIGTVGYISAIVGAWLKDDIVSTTGVLILIFNWIGQTSLHILTCVERYLAVVHPITYLRLRNEGGIRLRNVSIGCMWLLCAVITGLATSAYIIYIMNYVLLTLASVVISFCSVSVLLVLLRPGPGQSRDRVDRSKRRAFYTIMTISGALLLKFSGNLLLIEAYMSVDARCVLAFFQILLGLPSSLVLPLLFLHRKGKLAPCRRKTQ